jgi:uncharacterized protein (TIGR03437 family)
MIENAQGADAAAVMTPPVLPIKERTFQANGETWEHITTASGVNIDAAFNQAAPAAFANSLAWLATQHTGFELPDDHERGLRGDNTLVGRVDTASSRAVTSRAVGSGLTPQAALAGKFAYLAQSGVSSRLTHKYVGSLRGPSGSTSADFTSSGITAKNEGAAVTFTWICDQIMLNEDVEIVYEWTSAGQRGAHMVRVFGCGRMLGLPYLYVLDDVNQTSTDPEDRMGERTTRWWVTETGGALALDNDRPIVAAIAESLTDELKLTAGGSPITFRKAVTNGASFAVNSLAGAAFGTAFGFFPNVNAQPAANATRTASSSRGALATEMLNTRLLLNGQPIPLYSVSATQINFQVPPNAPIGPATLIVEQGDLRSALTMIDIQAVAPGIILIGADRGAIQNQDFSLHTPQNPAKPGGALVLYVTGLGATDVPLTAGEPTPAVLVKATGTVTATIGGQPAEVFFAGMTAGFVGLGQVNVFIPQLAPGEYPLKIAVSGKESNTVLVNIVAP